MASHVIKVEALTRTCGDLSAADQVSFEIDQGEIVGLLGHNGAGKTTTMKMLTGYLEPTGGSIEVDGLNIATQREAVQSRIAYLPENDPLNPEMTVIGQLTEDKLIAQGPAQSLDEIGLTVQTLTPQLAEQFDVKPGEGVVVTEVRPGSIAAMAGIETGSVILQVNREPVGSAADFQRAVKQSAADKRVLLLVRKGGMQRYVALSW